LERPAAERVTVDQLADALLVHMENQGRASVDKIRCHLKPVRAFFAGPPGYGRDDRRARALPTRAARREEAPATVNREVQPCDGLNVAAAADSPVFRSTLSRTFHRSPVDNVRSGFFERAEVKRCSSTSSTMESAIASRGLSHGIAQGRDRAADSGTMLDRPAPRGPEDSRSDHEETNRPNAGTRGSVRAIIERRPPRRRSIAR